MPKGYGLIKTCSYGHNSLKHGQYVPLLVMISFTMSATIITTLCHYSFGLFLVFRITSERKIDAVLHCLRIECLISVSLLSFLFLFSTMLILAELKKKDWVWDKFVYGLSNSHFKSSLGNEPCEPCIPDIVDKAPSVNISEHQISHIQEPAVKSCKKVGPSHTKKSPVSKGQRVRSSVWGRKGS